MIYTNQLMFLVAWLLDRLAPVLTQTHPPHPILWPPSLPLRLRLVLRIFLGAWLLTITVSPPVANAGSISIP